jgi:hypothetical protein
MNRRPPVELFSAKGWMDGHVRTVTIPVGRGSPVIQPPKLSTKDCAVSVDRKCLSVIGY